MLTGKFAEVILPLPLENSYTYLIPPDLYGKIKPGCRVLVHFGKKRYYTAIVLMLHDRQPETGYEIKEIFALLDIAPILRRPQLQFWEWLSSYYLCKLGDVYKAAVPSGLKLESETVVVFNEAFETELKLRPNEQAVMDAFTKKDRLTIAELEKITGLRNVVPAISSLMAYGAVEVNEEIKKGFTAKTQTFIRLAEACREEENLQKAFSTLKRAPKQESLLLFFLDISHSLNPSLAKEISKKELLEQSGANTPVLDAILKRGILEAYEKEVGRLQTPVCRLRELAPLTEAQQKAEDGILESFKTKDVCLLHGVTSSGKTEIYSHLINRVLAQGRQVLYLLPEIAVTTQITERLARVFGDKLLVYHSKFPDNERVEVWNKLLMEKGPMLVLGVRSSMFLPFSNLGLVIVDEEHETSYKQQEPAPRYHARNAAIVLARMHGAKAILGSATPSLDSYYNALSGKYGLVELTTRYGEVMMPEVLTADLKELRRKKIMKDTLFSPLLVQKIKEALGNGEQVILFQNRRGFAPLLECKSCGWVPHCVNCDVSLTYHKYQNRLVCHYCGYSEPFPAKCPACGSEDIKMLGFGTEKIEEEVAALFPEAKAERLDFDSARTRHAYERIIDDFETGKTNILIGTQMLSKGLDFGNVSVVGILNADSLMNIPDFRAHERAFQLIVQVSGRAGRRAKRGVVVLQTSQPGHPVVRLAQEFDYKEMANLQLAERKMFRYPPYYRLIYIVIRSRNVDMLREMSDLFADSLKKKLGSRVLGPVIPPVTRVQTLSVRKILLKIEITASVDSVRKIITDTHAEMQRYLPFKQLLVHYDVDPV